MRMFACQVNYLQVLKQLSGYNILDIEILKWFSGYNVLDIEFLKKGYQHGKTAHKRYCANLYD